MMAQHRAKWSSRYARGLVDILTEYRLSHYRGQNGWCTEGWNKIAKEFNTNFPEAKFTKSQIQDKEAQFKKDYKAIKSILRRSGVSWKNDVSIINTTPAKWQEIIQEDSKLARFENKSFPLFDPLDLLYQGQFAEGKHCFTSSQVQKSRGRSIDAEARDKVTLDFTQKCPWRTPTEVGATDGDGEGHSPVRYEEYERPGLESESVQERDNLTSQQVEEAGEHPQCERQNKRRRLRTAQNHQYEPGNISDRDDNDEWQQSDELETSRSVAAGSKRGRLRSVAIGSRFAAPVPRIEETTSEFLALKKRAIHCQGVQQSATR